MDADQWAKELKEERKFVKSEMGSLNACQLAGLANLSPITVTRFLEGMTFSPHRRTTSSLVDALGWEDIKVRKGSGIRGKTG